MAFPREEYNKIKKFVKKNGYNLNMVPDCYKADRGIVLADIRKNGKALHYASETLKHDGELISIAVITDGSVIRFASANLINYKELFLTAIITCDDTLKFASPALQDDKDVVLSAITKNPYNLEYASSRLRNDRETVKTAVTKCGRVFRFASKDLKRDEEMALFALSCPKKCNNLDCKFKDDSDYSTAIYYVCSLLLYDLIFIFKSVKIDGYYIAFIPEDIINYYDLSYIMVYAIHKSGIDVLQYVPHDHYYILDDWSDGNKRCYYNKY